MQEIESGSLDACLLDFPFQKIKDVKINLKNKVKPIENQPITARYIYINKSKNEFEKRQAIAHSLNIDKIMEELELPPEKN
ncbi:MAG: hypothetical protein ACQBVK_03520 [Candidatus Phytoplasma sp. TWB_XP]